MKHKALTLTVAAVLLGIPFTAAVPAAAAPAENLSPAISGRPAAERPLERQANLQADKISGLKAKAEAEIDRRLASLDKLQAVINGIKKIGDADKASLLSELQTQITELTDLKNKIAAETDIVALRVEVQSIVKSYRIYALFIPKIHILAAADRMTTTADNLTQLAAKLQTRLDGAKVVGLNVTALEADLKDMQTKIAEAKVQAAAAVTTVTPLTPEGYPGNRTQLQSAQAQIKSALSNLNNARQDAKTIIQGLKALGAKKTTTPTLTPTAVEP